MHISAQPVTIEVERAYARAHVEGGARFLVDRMWPRAVPRVSLKLDAWLRDAAPSERLRRWFGHDPARWAKFQERYFKELDANPDAVAPLLDAAGRGGITLVYGAKDEAHNNAVALRDYLVRRLRHEAPANDSPTGRPRRPAP